MPSLVAIVRCDSYDRAAVEDAFARGIELLGDTVPLPAHGGRLLLKPNFLYAVPREKGVTTDPEVVRAAATTLTGRADRIEVGDSPGFDSAEKVARISGVASALAGTGADIVPFKEARPVSGVTVHGLELAASALGADGLVNLARFKTHGMMGLTLAVKNLFGCVPGFRKPRWHFKTGENRDAFARILIEIAAALPAGVHVLDAILAMEGNGPGSGTLRPLGCLLFSADPVALDRVACDLVGYPAEDLRIFQAARDRGFGETEMKQIERVGDDLSSFSVTGFEPARPTPLMRFIPLPQFLLRRIRGLATPAPVVRKHMCRGCGICARTCPAGAIAMVGGGAKIDRKRCVRCMCCQEMCPEGAIRVRRGWF